ncbi:T9SS type A sorting domain-containing protein [Bacteroidota bacterium]
MKIWIYSILSLLIIEVSPLFAQNIIPVEPGRGTLEQAILNAGAGDIIQLNSGGIYTLSSEASSFGKINMPLSIVLEPGTTEKAVIKLGEGASRTKKYYFFTIDDGADLTLRGLDIHGILDDTIVASSMVVFDARPDPSIGNIGNFRFEDCVFHDFKDYIIHGMKDAYARGLVQDSVFINNVSVYHAKHFLQYKHVSLRHLEMTNTTVYSLKGMALKIGKIGYRAVAGVSDVTITPTGFIDHCTLDDLGDIHGHIQVDDAYHLLTISNCIISNQQQYEQPPVYFTDPAASLVVRIHNTCFWDVGPPNSDVGGSQWIGYEFADTVYRNPNYLDAENGDFSLPSYSSLLSASSDGGQIGDLRWGTYPAVGIAENKTPGQETYYLSQNYPNPFEYSTSFDFNLNEPEYVSIKIYSILGKEIVSLVDEIKPAGKHTITWHTKDLEKGIYICRMTAGQFSALKKVILK